MKSYLKHDNHYRDNDDCRLFYGMLDGLLFLSLENVHEGMQYAE